jgi:transposase
MSDRHVRYAPEFKERAIRMARECRPEYPSDAAAFVHVAELLGVGTPETIRNWVNQADVDAGKRPGVSSEESAEIRRLKREVAELRRANSILKAASAFFAAEIDRPGA